MSDLISRSDLWTDIMMLPHNGDIISSKEVEQAIAEAPAVDAVEVVRCKDCKHQMGDGACVMMDQGGANEGFCYYGERKDNG